MFGRTFRAVPVRPLLIGTGLHGIVPSAPLRPAFELREVADAAHGTRRPVDEIVRLFHEGSAPAYTSGQSVNRVWRPAHVQFVLAGIADQTIDSAQADFVSADVRFRPNLSAYRYDNAVNIFFFRDLEGARGCVFRGDILMGDRWSPGDDAGSREAAWRGDVITVSHELGHVFDLSHRENVNNLMYGGGTAPASLGIRPAQAVFAQERARVYRRPWYRPIPADDDVLAAPLNPPHVLGYAGQRVPSFD